VSAKGRASYYVSDFFYSKSHDDVDLYTHEHKLPIAVHGACSTSSCCTSTRRRGRGSAALPTMPFESAGQTPEQWTGQRVDARIDGVRNAGDGGQGKGRRRPPNGPDGGRRTVEKTSGVSYVIRTQLERRSMNNCDRTPRSYAVYQRRSAVRGAYIDIISNNA